MIPGWSEVQMVFALSWEDIIFRPVIRPQILLTISKNQFPKDFWNANFF